MNPRNGKAAGRGISLRAGLCAAVLTLCTGESPPPGAPEADTALVVSVDVSSSVDERRYELQMRGIAMALEDQRVVDALLSGTAGGILFTMVTWADHPRIAVPWTRIASREDALRLAGLVHRLPHEGGDFTCVARMLRFIGDKVVPQTPARAARIIVDVSGDGSDNCNPDETVPRVRDELAARGVTINGLPILDGREAATIEGWYRDNVVGGPGAFVLPAASYEDFGRAIRQKFVIEISQRTP